MMQLINQGWPDSRAPSTVIDLHLALTQNQYYNMCKYNIMCMYIIISLLLLCNEF